MNERHRTIRFSLGNLMALIAACGVMAAVMPASLQQLKQRMAPATCANNLRSNHQAWSVYGNDYGGKWMAPWERANPWWNYGHTSQISGNIMWVMTWPYTMVQFVTGGGIPAGETVYMSGRPGSSGPWYAPDGRHGYPAEYCSSPNEAAQLQCATTAAKGPIFNTWFNVTSYSYAIMGGHEGSDGIIRYTVDSYPTPDLMTHPATTILLHDLSGILAEGRTNMWSTFEGFPTEPHSDKSNYLFCDGHVELLPLVEINEEMWKSQWTPEP